MKFWDFKVIFHLFRPNFFPTHNLFFSQQLIGGFIVILGRFLMKFGDFFFLTYFATVKVYNMYALELGKTGFLRTLGMSCTLH